MKNYDHPSIEFYGISECDVVRCSLISDDEGADNVVCYY